MAPTPTKTLPLGVLSPNNNHNIVARQVTTTASPTTTVTLAPPANSDNSSSSSSGGSSLDTGAIVGIVIGVVVAILLIIWAVRSLSGPARAPDTDRQGWYDDDDDDGHRHHHHHGRRHHHRGHDHHGASRSRSRSHQRRRSVTPHTRPGVVVLGEKVGDAGVRRPGKTYVYGDAGRRSRSQGRSRERSGSRGYYTTY